MILHIDVSSDIPIYMQIRNEIVQGIAKGELLPSMSLPTVRAMASQLSVNPMTVNKAYALLKQEGYIVMNRRQGAMIANREEGSYEDMEQKLRLLASEACAKGMKKQDFLQLCDRLTKQLHFK